MKILNGKCKLYFLSFNYYSGVMSFKIFIETKALMTATIFNF